MINNTGYIGRAGEGMACQYLLKNGYKILDKNFRKKFGEIDIIARSSDKTLVFCEVKTMVENPGFSERLRPEDNLTFHKAQKMKRAAQFFAANNPDLIYEERGWRIDLVAIVLSFDHKTVRRIQHYENV
jgi:putative endonuclease